MDIYPQNICSITNKKYLTSYRQGCRCVDCKAYKRSIDLKYRQQNQNLIKEKQKKYYQKNKKRCIEKSARNYQKNRERRKEYLKNYYQKNKNKYQTYYKNYYLKNKPQISNTNKIYEYKKYNSNALFAFQKRLRKRIRSAFVNMGWKKGRSQELLGADFDTVKKYFEKLFTDGMSWENRSEWHIDHIIPLSSAKTEEELKQLCHYTNLQPLWGIDNLKKGNKII
jgi:hypothetical protein